jgi:hypothetical protein
MSVQCLSEYRHVAVVEIDRDILGNNEPKMISARAKGVKKIHWCSPPTYVGKTERCAFQKALKKANEIRDRLSAA